MKLCPYHYREVVSPGPAGEGAGIAYLRECCGLPIWVCARGCWSPWNASYCVEHGTPRPAWEGLPVSTAGSTPRLIPLDALPAEDGASQPCLIGDVLVYRTADRHLRAARLGAKAPCAIALLDQVSRATCVAEDQRLFALVDRGSSARRQLLAWPLHALLARLDDVQAGRAPRALRFTEVVRPIEHRSLPGVAQELTVRQSGLELSLRSDAQPSSELRRVINGHPFGAFVIPLPGGWPPGVRPGHLLQLPMPLPGGLAWIGSLQPDDPGVGCCVVPARRSLT